MNILIRLRCRATTAAANRVFPSITSCPTNNISSIFSCTECEHHPPSALHSSTDSAHALGHPDSLLLPCGITPSRRVTLRKEVMMQWIGDRSSVTDSSDSIRALVFPAAENDCSVRLPTLCKLQKKKLCTSRISFIGARENGSDTLNVIRNEASSAENKM